MSDLNFSGPGITHTNGLDAIRKWRADATEAIRTNLEKGYELIPANPRTGECLTIVRRGKPNRLIITLCPKDKEIGFQFNWNGDPPREDRDAVDTALNFCPKQ